MKKLLLSLVLSMVFLTSLTYAVGVVKVSSNNNNVHLHCEDGVHKIGSYKSIDFPEASKFVDTIKNPNGNLFQCEDGRCFYTKINYGKFYNLNDVKVEQQKLNVKFGKGSCLQKAQEIAGHSC